jgi:hypothetical protein
MRLRFVLCRNCLKWFILVIMLDHLIVNFFDSSSLIFNEWRMLILDYRVTYVCSRSVERRLWWDVKFDEASHQTWEERLIKLDESDSSNLMSEKTSSHQTWWMKTSSHQIWRKRLIKLDDVISSSRTNASSHQTFEKRDSFSTFWWAIFCSDIWCEELSLAQNHLLCEDCCDKWAFLMKANRWYNSAFFYKERASSYVKTMNDCRRSDSSSS